MGSIPTSTTTANYTELDRFYDPFQDATMSRTDAVRYYGWAVIGKESRRATREEIRNYCELLKVPNHVS